jgi:hypothetical protein
MKIDIRPNRASVLRQLSIYVKLEKIKIQKNYPHSIVTKSQMSIYVKLEKIKIQKHYPHSIVTKSQISSLADSNLSPPPKQSSLVHSSLSTINVF